MEKMLATEKGYDWVPASNGAIPPDAVVGGQEPGRNLYVCRAEYQGGVHPGKLVGNCCNIGWDGREIRIPHYEVLVCKLEKTDQDGSHSILTYHVSSDGFIAPLSKGIDIVNGGIFPNIFSSFPTPVPVGGPTTDKKTTVTIVESVDEYKELTTTEADLGGKYKNFVMNLKGSWASKNSVKTTQSVIVIASGWKFGHTFQPDFSRAVLNIDLSAFTSYSEFIARHGSHFIGGYIAGVSYAVVYIMNCDSYSDAKTLAARVSLTVGNSDWGVNLSASIEQARTSSGVRSKIYYETIMS